MSLHATPVAGTATPLTVSANISLDSFAAGLDAGRRSVLDVVRRLAEEAELSVFLVGGPVRDALLGMPVMDLDFSVVGDATAFAVRLGERMGGRVTLHRRFGTATVVVSGQWLVAGGRLLRMSKDGMGGNPPEFVEGPLTTRHPPITVDLVTARRETYRSPGALPFVEPGSIDDDLARRDFTVNAMALPVSARSDRVIDPSGGMDDLERGVIRILHSRSFVDDPTRMLRAVRYEQRFGLRIESGTLDSLAATRDAGFMASVSGDRWRREIERILAEKRPGPALIRAAELGLLAGIHPCLAGDDGLMRLASQPSESLGPGDWLAGLFASLSEAEGRSVAERLRLAGTRAAVARDTISLRDSEQAVLAAGKASQLARILNGKSPEAVAAWAKLTGNPQVAAALGRFLNELPAAGAALSGRELLDMGVPQGPAVGEILGRLHEARLDGLVNGEEEERALALSLLGECRADVAKPGWKKG